MCDIIEYPHYKITIVVEAMNCPMVYTILWMWKTISCKKPRSV
jgi:hypothetical protein